MIFKLKTSKETMNIFNEMGASIRLQPFALVKLSIALVIRTRQNLIEEDFIADGEGLELNRQTITGEYDELFKALIINNEQRQLTDEEYFPRYLKAYIDKGAKMLYSEFKYSGSKFYEHLLELEKSI